MQTNPRYVCIKGESFDGVSEWDGQRFQPTNRAKDFVLSGEYENFINTVAIVEVSSYQRSITYRS